VAADIDAVPMEDREIGAASLSRHHDFAVDDRGAGGNVPRVVGDLAESFGPVVAAAVEDPHGFFGEVDLHTVAVELDLMDPAIGGAPPRSSSPTRV